jgi:NAD(P)H dehydrogenase (quinone)
MPRILVVYYSRTGNTKKLVEGFVNGVKRVSGVEVVVRSVEEAKVEELLYADAIVFASPSYFRLPAWPLKKFIDESIAVYEKLEGKLGGALCSAGSEIGAIKCVQALKDVVEEHGMVFVGEGVWCIESPGDEDLEKAANYGETIARAVIRTKG